MEKLRNNLAIALELYDKEYIPVAIVHGLKVPAEPWRHFLDEGRTRESVIERWHGTRLGIAILCKDLVVIDVDEENKLEKAMDRCGLTSAPICRTPSGGFHIHGKIRKGVERSRKIRIHDEPCDLLTGPSLSILPPSIGASGVPYEWITEGLPHINDLPLVKVGWTRERTKRQLHSLVVESSPDIMVRRARAYLACVEGAISGQGGSRVTFRVACKLTHPYPKGFGLTIPQSWPLIKEWNEQCEPPWSDRELLHKLEDAVKKIG